MRRIVYLHGFASSPQSRKAVVLAEKLRGLGFRVDIPALDEGNFQGLSISGQLAVVDRLVAGESVILIGSSLGGYLASLFAARHPEVDRLVLLAPAFRFYELWENRLTPEQKNEWQLKGVLSLYHYGTGESANIGYQLLEDAAQYEPSPDFHQPALIIHGDQDDSVPVSYSIEFASAHPNCQLVRLTSGHELTDVLDVIWQLTEKFVLAP